MLHYLNPNDKTTWPPRGSYFYAKLNGPFYWNEPLNRYILLYEFFEVPGYGTQERFVEASGEMYWEVAPEEIEYWLSFDELDECIKFFEENSLKKI